MSGPAPAPRRAVTSALVGSFLLGLTAQACFTAQPPPPCQLVSTQDWNGNPPYLALLRPLEVSSACSDDQRLSAMQVGAQDFVPPGTGPASLALKPERLVQLAQGDVFRADTDASNNCQAALEGRRTPTCGSCAPDGGNPCLSVPDPVVRVDPTDPRGARQTAVGPFPREPTAGVCAAPEPLVAEQQFEAVTAQLVDGGTLTFPALTARFEFSELKVLTTFEVPGTAFTAKLTQTEGACTARYDVVAFYPAVHCETNADCDPNPDLDAGRTIGSGINGDFDPVCDVALGFCVPRVDVTKPGLPKL